jgi:hypothetical protein
VRRQDDGSSACREFTKERDSQMKMRNDSQGCGRVSAAVRLAGFTAAGMACALASAAEFIGPLPYSQSGDGPLPLGGLGPIVVNTFETEEPLVGMQVFGATTRVLGDSVDADDEILDGDGSTGHSLELFGAAMLVPDASALGGAPTRFGIVVTNSLGTGGGGGGGKGDASLSIGDGGPQAFVRITVVDVNMVQSTYDFPADSFGSNATDDQFIGVVVPEGIASINVSSNFPTVRIDHVQYDSAAALPQQFVRDDFDGDRRSDVAWYRAPGQKCAIWNVLGTTVTGAYTGIVPPSSTARIVGTGDANADAKADIFWYDPATKRFTVWFMNAFAATPVQIDRVVSESWIPVSFIDLDGDLVADVVFRKTEPGVTKIAVWLMNPNATIRQAFLNTLDGEFAGAYVGFLNGDTNGDILLRKAAGEPDAGALYVASFAGSILSTPTRMLSLAGAQEPAVAADYTIAGLADTDGDGVDDIIWRTPTGGVERWDVRALRVESKALVWASTTFYWSIVGFPDFDGDAKRGILFRGRNGETWRWEMNGNAITASDPLRTVITSWKTAGMQF